jgi:hypothetical protein
MTVRRSSMLGAIIGAGTLALAALLLHAGYRISSDQMRLLATADLVRTLELSDLCLFTEASYTRHLSLADLRTPFQEYPLYATLLLGAITGMDVGILMPFRNRPSLTATLPGFQRRLALTSVISWGLFTLIATWPIVFSSFRLEGY